MTKESKKITLDELLKVAKPETLVKSLSYESAEELLELLVEAVEAGGLSLENSVLAYERGSLIINHMQALLDEAEKKLKVLTLKKSKNEE